MSKELNVSSVGLVNGSPMRDCDWDLVVNAIILLGDWIWQVANSSFFVALSGAFAGAVAGAYTVRRIERKQSEITQFRRTNAAIAATFALMNTFLGYKGQIVKPIRDNFVKLDEEHKEFLRRKRAGLASAEQPFVINADFQVFEMVHPPIDVLQKLISQDVTISGQTLIAFYTLSTSYYELHGAVKKRSELIAEYRAKKGTSYDQIAPFYFGVPNSDGHVDTNFRDSIFNIYSKTDECIWFSNFVMRRLVNHATGIKEKANLKNVEVTKPDFTKSIELIPDDKGFEDWLT